ncbi:hypothetical protein [Flavobacterium aciduliphilum]|uniref:Collagen triple helix repeat protein n=1 Tax=Flavobacterium aciduliphilum TaxID=1101402 RepID=A0A328YUR0_9FLAO|nr:hypothetical protein [Flavobacterium aciduliphilum]RAR73796.1 hypothetical protein CLV55_103115 [Flavobacterium aciduliphilum]
MKKTLFKTSIVMLIALITMSCSKDGATGPAGPAGANGTNGTNGNANVIGTNSFTTTSSNWTSGGGGVFWTANLTGATSITQNIVDKGIVSVFRMYTVNGATQWSPLPDTNINQNLSFSYGVGTISFLMQSTNATAIANPGAITLRYVVISPSNKRAHPNTNWNNYEEVKEVLHLQD